ncbi:MAG: hypothetical protein ACREA0_22205, partial [bacterium]
MKVLTYRIHLKAPALLGSLEGDPNASTSLDYLPGSALRGALIKRYPSSLDPTDGTVRALFFDGRTRFLNGYPVRFLSPIEGQRALPVPLSFFLEKNEQGPWYDFSMDPGDPAKAWQPAPSRFAVLDMDDEGVTTAYRLEPELEMKVHTQRTSRLLGRAVEGEGAVYRYESLARGQWFEAAILCDEPGVVTTLRDLLAGRHRLGSALTGGYGEIEVDTLKEPEKWRECGGELDTPEDGAFTLTLLSDAIVRDESGQHAATVGALLHGLRAYIPNGTLSDEDAFL